MSRCVWWEDPNLHSPPGSGPCGFLGPGPLAALSSTIIPSKELAPGDETSAAPLGLNPLVSGTTTLPALSPLVSGELAEEIAFFPSLAPGGDPRAGPQGALQLSQDRMSFVLQTSETVATSSSGNSWTASCSRLSSRMRGAWILTRLPWRTSMSRTLSTCEQWPSLTCLRLPSPSLSSLASHQQNLSSLSQTQTGLQMGPGPKHPIELPEIAETVSMHTV